MSAARARSRYYELGHTVNRIQIAHARIRPSLVFDHCADTRSRYNAYRELRSYCGLKIISVKHQKSVVICGCKGVTVRWSERSLLQRVITPKGHYSEGSLLRRVITPKGHYSEGSLPGASLDLFHWGGRGCKGKICRQSVLICQQDRTTGRCPQKKRPQFEAFYK